MPGEDGTPLGVEAGDARRQLNVVVAGAEDRNAVALPRRRPEAPLPRRRMVGRLARLAVEISSIAVVPAASSPSGIVLMVALRGCPTFGRRVLRGGRNVGPHGTARAGRPGRIPLSLALAAIVALMSSLSSRFFLLRAVGRRGEGGGLLGPSLWRLGPRFGGKKLRAPIVSVPPSPATLASLGAFAGLGFVSRRLLRRAAFRKGKASAFIRGLFGSRSVGLLAGPGVAWFHGPKTIARNQKEK